MKKNIYTLILIIAMFTMTACSSNKSAGSYYDEGIEALEEGRYEEACSSFKEAIALKDDFAIYYIEYGQALTKLGNYKEALKQYKKAVVDVDSSITNENKKKALRGQGVAYYYMGQYENAVNTFKEALKLDYANDLNTDIRSYLGQCYVKQEKYDEALAVYDALVEEQGSSSVYAGRGSVNASAGNIEEAKQDFEKAISLDEKNYSLYLLGYQTLMKAEDTESAKAFLTKAAAIEPKTTEDSYALAQVKFYQEDYKGALDILEKLVSEKQEAYQFMGDIYYVTKEYDNAIKNYLTYMENGKQSVSSTCYANLSSCYIAQKQYENALSYVNLGLAAGDKISEQELQYNEILIYEQMGDFNTAYEKAKVYVEKYPEDEQMNREYIFLSTRYNK